MFAAYTIVTCNNTSVIQQYSVKALKSSRIMLMLCTYQAQPDLFFSRWASTSCFPLWLDPQISSIEPNYSKIWVYWYLMWASHPQIFYILPIGRLQRRHRHRRTNRPMGNLGVESKREEEKGTALMKPKGRWEIGEGEVTIWNREGRWSVSPILIWL